MLKNKLTISLIFIACIIPQAAFASWWNPFSWTFFKKKNSTNTTINVSTTTEQINIPVSAGSAVKNEGEGTTTIAYVVAIEGNKITLDYVDFYYGKEAKKKMTEDGMCEGQLKCAHVSDTTWYYRNKNPLERTFTIAQNVIILDSKDRPRTLEYISTEGISVLVKDKFSDNPNLEYRRGKEFAFTFSGSGEISKIKDLSAP